MNVYLVTLLLSLFVFPSASWQPSSPSLKGRLLVASGQIRDPRFSKSVILMIEHDENGAMGLIVNKVMATANLSELFESIGLDPPQSDSEFSLHFGGPVEIDRTFILHSDEVMGRNSFSVGNGVAVAFDSELLQAIGSGKGPKQHLLLVGYAGWAPQQLEAEIARGDWVTQDAAPGLIFSKTPENTWDDLMEGTVFRL